MPGPSSTPPTPDGVFTSSPAAPHRAAPVPPDVPAAPPLPNAAGSWTFLTNHAHVLLCLAAAPGARLRDVADAVGITERAVQHIVADLAAAGVLVRAREGRRNRYTLNGDAPLRHPIEAHRRVADLMELAPGAIPESTPARRAGRARE